MKSLTEYTNEQKSNNYLQFVQESVDNNIRMINEGQLIVDHGKDIDNILYRCRQYFNNHIHNRINESENDYKFTLSEQEAVRDLLIFVCEDYKEKLLNECSIYEGLINDTISINEAEFQLGAVVNNLWKQGKDKVEKIYNDAKTKIKELNELIKAFANKTIDSLKEFANKIVDFIEKIGSSLLKIAQKIGFGDDKVAEISDELIDDIKANPEKVTKNDIYESLGNEILKEGVVDWVQNSKAGKWYAEKKQKPLWNAFFQFCNWLLVCKVLPMVVLAVFPGGLVYYLISIAVKVIWNIKKLKGLIKQTKDYINGWNTFGKWERIWKAAALLFMWYLWWQNVVSIAGNAGKVVDAFKKSLESGDFWKMMFGKAHTGIEPDKLEAMGAAVIRWAGKGFSGSISDAYNEIMDACKEVTGTEALEAAKKAVEAAKDAAEAAKATAEQTEETTGKITNLLDQYKGKHSMEVVNKVKDFCSGNGLSIDNIKPDQVYRFCVDGSYKNLVDQLENSGLSEDVIDGAKKLLNKSLQKVNSNAGSMTIVELPGKVAQLLAAKNKLGANGHFGIIGEVVKEIATGGGSLPAVVASFSAAMASDVPIITFKQKGNGFRVRLGDEKSKNYIYEVGKDDVKFVKPSEIDNDKVKKAYEKIKEVINDENKKFIEKIKSSDLKEDEKKKLIKQVEVFANGGKDENGNEHKPYAEELAKTPLVVIHGTRLSEDDQKKYDGKESLKSLYNYLLNEAEEEKSDKKEYTADDVLLNLKDLRKHLNKKGKENSTQNDKGKETFNGNVEIILRSVFSTKETGKASKFVYDKDYKPEPYESVRKRAKDENYKFGPDDINVLAFWFAEWYAGGDKNYYEELCGAFVDVIMLKHQLKENKEVNDTIITIYKEMIDHLTKAEEFKKEIDGKEWKPNEQWAPLKFDESKVDPEVEEKVKKAEDEGAGDMSKKETEEAIEQTGDTVPDEEDKKEESDKKDDESSEEDDSEHQPVLIFSNVYGMDIAKANEKGPRKEIYSLKGAFHSLEFLEIKHGMNKHDIQEMLGEWMYTMVNNLCNISAISPFEKKKNWWKDKFIPNKNLKENEERREFGNLTNGEIADIMNKKENAKNYVLVKTNSLVIAQDEDDKKYAEDKKKKYEEKLKNADEETVKAVKEIDPDAIDDDGKVKPEKVSEISDKLSSYSLAQYKAKDTKKSDGFFGKIKKFVKGLFGGNKEEGEKYNSLLKHFDESLNESFNESEYDKFLNEMFKPLTLQEFINEKKL